MLRPNEPALYLIDFDAFVAPAAGADQAIDLADGGTYGTEGYCPPDLASCADGGDGSVAPYSDRYGRDMLMLELLLMDSDLSSDDCASRWNRETLQAPVCRDAGFLRSGQAASVGTPEPGKCLFVGGKAAAAVGAACGQLGVGVARESRDLHGDSDSGLPCGHARRPLGLDTRSPTARSPAGIWQGAKPPSIARTVSAAQSLVGQCPSRDSHAPANAKSGIAANVYEGCRVAAGRHPFAWLVDTVDHPPHPQSRLRIAIEDHCRFWYNI